MAHCNGALHAPLCPQSPHRARSSERTDAPITTTSGSDASAHPKYMASSARIAFRHLPCPCGANTANPSLTARNTAPRGKITDITSSVVDGSALRNLRNINGYFSRADPPKQGSNVDAPNSTSPPRECYRFLGATPRHTHDEPVFIFLNSHKFLRLNNGARSLRRRSGMRAHPSIPHGQISQRQGDHVGRAPAVVLGAQEQASLGARIIGRAFPAPGRDDSVFDGPQQRRGRFGSSHVMSLLTPGTMLRCSGGVTAIPTANIVEPRP